MNGPALLYRVAVFALGVAMLAVTYWLYSPGVRGPAMLDDYSSLERLEYLKQAPEEAWDYVLGDSSGPLGRSVSIASFVGEQLLGAGGVASAKRVNIVIHLLTGTCVAWFFYLLLAAHGTPLRATAAILFAGFWLLTPLQVSTVLYLVQRMAQLAALFCLLALISYLYWRRSLAARTPRHRYLLLAILAFAAGLFSKENALVTLPLLLLLEACWLQFRDDQGRTIHWLRRFTWIAICGGALAVGVLLLLYWGKLTTMYTSREFTLEQRLLTEPRILWDYVAQFYWPDVARMSIFHDDYTVSTSLRHPATTLPALLAWFALLASIALAWRWPFARRLALGPLFFLAGQSLESSVWPLELYFEHRNYLPGVGLALLPMALYAGLAERWREVGKPLLAWLVFALAWVASLTSSQVQVWSSAPLLAMQQSNAHPDSARASRGMATQLATVGAVDAALEYSGRAYTAALANPAAGDEHHGDYIMRNIALACIAGKPLSYSQYSELGRVEPGRPLGDVATISVVIQLQQENRCPDFDWNGFLDHLHSLYLQRFDTSLASANVFTALAMLSNAQQRWEDAYAYTARSLALLPGRHRELLMQLHFVSALGREDERKSLIVQLKALRDAGKLSRGERDTLALYPEG